MHVKKKKGICRHNQREFQPGEGTTVDARRQVLEKKHRERLVLFVAW